MAGENTGVGWRRRKGAAADVGTFGGAKGDNLTIFAHGGKWYVEAKTNVTLA